MSLKMPFGKCKGRDIDDIPSSYLKWVAENFEESTPQKKALVEAADKEYQYREKNGIHWDEDKEPKQRETCPHCGGVL